ncbi:hypothetical protein CDD83_484 [Cordyceps sp. RAO-2017]|nr:hypothetical protein CDD83_484 [Cordyceps sp. RAO-2017]
MRAEMLGVVPPVELGHVAQAAAAEPALEPEPDEEVHGRVPGLDRRHGRAREVVVVAVADDDGVDERHLRGRARRPRVPPRAHEGQGRAAVLEDRVEQDAQPGRELDVAAGVPEPRRPEPARAAAPAGQPLGLDHRDPGRAGVGHLETAGHDGPGEPPPPPENDASAISQGDSSCAGAASKLRRAVWAYQITSRSIVVRPTGPE